MTGIEPALSAWEAEVLPLNYIREAESTWSAKQRAYMGAFRSGQETALGRKVGFGEDVRRQMLTYKISREHPADQRVFTRSDGSAPRHFHVKSAWKAARLGADQPELRFHDMRHIGLTMLAEAGIPITGLMATAGRSTVGAAMVLPAPSAAV